MLKSIKKNAMMLLVVAFAGMISCSKNDVSEQNLSTTTVRAVTDSAAYLSALRAYKESDHPIMAGYYRTWGDALVESGAGQKTMYAIPDSVDIVNIFSAYTPDDHPYWTTLKNGYIPYLHERGTKVVKTYGIPSSNVTVMTDAELNDWVQAKVTQAAEYNYDGIDLDFESGGGTTSSGLYGGIFSGTQADLQQTYRKIEALSKYYGPKSGTDKLLILDLNYVNLSQDFLKSIEGYIDYFFMQRYFGGQLDKLFTDAYAPSVPAKKYVLGASFEDGSGRRGSPALFYQYATWQPVEGQAKGGIFSYGIDADGSYSSPSYVYTKTAIQMMNPAK